ncbi:MAG: O-antigen ligase family protein [Candidatus Coproplasma sp.]
MDCSGVVGKFNINKVKAIAEKIFTSPAFPFVTAGVTVLSTTFGLEPLIIWYICLCGAAITLCCKDISPVVCLFVFMNTIISMKHSPDARVEWCDETYMTSTAFIIQATIAILIFAGSAVYRIVDSIIKHRFKITPIFIGLCAYVVALLLNGLFSSKYYFMDTVYGLGMGAIILFMFVYISGNVVVNQDTYKRIAIVLVAFCLSLALQLLEAYITLEVVVDGVINRGRIQFGWGTYNQFGMLITVCIPAWFFLATKFKYGYLFLLGVAFNLAVAVLCMSRQAILCSAVIAVACCIWYLVTVPKKQKIFGGVVLIAFAIAALVVFLVKKEEFMEMFKDLATSFSTGSGRTKIWRDGLKKFLHNPIFGNGFYDITATETNTPGFNGEGYGFTEAIPFMCHNTLVQLLFACGAVGLIAYAVHRGQTIISLFKNPDGGRFFLMFTISGILFTSLLDNHIFYPLPLFLYTTLLAVFAVSEKRKETRSVCGATGVDRASALSTEGK